MRFLLDMNLPPAMADWLRSDGHDAVHAREIESASLGDREIFDRAAEERRVVITFDLDFGEIMGLAGGSGSGVLLFRLRRVGLRHLLDRLRVGLAEVADALQAGAIVIVENGRIRIRRTPPGS